MTTSRLSSNFIMVTCRCGRVLRAKSDQVGSEILCWDCQLPTLVEIPRERLRVLDLIFRNIEDLMRRPGSWRLVVLAGIAVVGMSVRWIGLGLGMGVLLAGAALYGDAVRYPDRLDSKYRVDWQRIRRELTPGRVLACLILVVATVGPLWVVGLGLSRPPHLGRVGLPVWLVGCLAAPIVMAAAYADPAGSHRWTDRLRFLRQYPLITLFVVAIVPMTLIGAEATIAGIIYARDLLPYFVLDFMPAPGRPQWVQPGYVFYDGVNFIDLPPARFVRGYGAALQQGHSFVGSLPPSLSFPSRHGLELDVVRLDANSFLQFRQFLVFLACVALVTGAAVQARCLSVLANANRQRLD